MKRITVPATFALVLCGLSGLVGCKGAGADSAKLIPDAATVVAGVDVAGLVKSSVYTANKAEIEKDGKEMLDIASACNLGIDTFKSVAVGFDPKSRGFAAVIMADGVGKPENLECVRGKLEAQQGSSPWKVEEQAGKKVLVLEDGTVGYLVNEGSLVVASKDWSGKVKDLIDGKGSSVFDGPLKDVIARADTGKTIWIAGLIPPERLAGTPGEGAKDAAGSIDLGSGIAIAGSIGFGSADDATKKKDELTKQLEAMRPLADTLGVPKPIVDSVEISASGSAVTVSARATEEDVKALAGLLAAKKRP
jgi:hypothetical protein